MVLSPVVRGLLSAADSKRVGAGGAGLLGQDADTLGQWKHSKAGMRRHWPFSP